MHFDIVSRCVMGLLTKKDFEFIFYTDDTDFLRDSARAALEVKRLFFGETIQLFHPGPVFPAFSLTGAECSLSCRHCNKSYLRGMIASATPQDLVRECLRLHKEGAKGCLLSGGFDAKGRLPIKPFLKAIRQIKRATGFKFAIHPGLLDQEEVKGLRGAGVDAVCPEIIGEPDVAERVSGLRRTGDDYLKALRLLKQEGFSRLAPHVCIGLDGGRMSHELNALQVAAQVQPDVVVLIVFTPTGGTAFQDCEPPGPMDVQRVVTIARLMMPETELALGCMRPGGAMRRRIDAAAISGGINRIAVPARSVVGSLRILERETCCVM